MKVTLNTTVIDLENQYLEGIEKGYIDISIPKDIEEKDLLFLIEKHKNRIYTIFIFEIIAEHKKSTSKVHELILENSKWKKEPGLINSIITSGNASIDTLKKFEGIQSTSVQEHLSLAYLKEKLKNIDSLNQYIEILDSLKGNDNIENHAKKFIIASYEKTPKEILMELSADSQIHISQEAKKNLSLRKD